MNISLKIVSEFVYLTAAYINNNQREAYDRTAEFSLLSSPSNAQHVSGLGHYGRDIYPKKLD